MLHMSPETSCEAGALAAQTRLRIPILIGEDCIHGHSFFEGATIFPTQLGMAASFDPDLLERVGRATAIEVATTGIHWTFSPVLCITRDLRWGRVSETFGEDPHLIGELAAAMIRGYQGDGLEGPDRDPRHRQALRRLLRDPGRPRRLRGRHLAPQAATRGSCRRSRRPRARAAPRSCSATRPSTACRSPSTSGCSATCFAGSGATRACSSPTGTTWATWCANSACSPTTPTPRRPPSRPETT